jgi:hypothetical protein
MTVATGVGVGAPNAKTRPSGAVKVASSANSAMKLSMSLARKLAK